MSLSIAASTNTTDTTTAAAVKSRVSLFDIQGKCIGTVRLALVCQQGSTGDVNSNRDVYIAQPLLYARLMRMHEPGLKRQTANGLLWRLAKKATATDGSDKQHQRLAPSLKASKELLAHHHKHTLLPKMVTSCALVRADVAIAALESKTCHWPAGAVEAFKQCVAAAASTAAKASTVTDPVTIDTHRVAPVVPSGTEATTNPAGAVAASVKIPTGSAAQDNTDKRLRDILNARRTTAAPTERAAAPMTPTAKATIDLSRQAGDDTLSPPARRHVVASNASGAATPATPLSHASSSSSSATMEHSSSGTEEVILVGNASDDSGSDDTASFKRFMYKQGLAGRNVATIAESAGAKRKRRRRLSRLSPYTLPAAVTNKRLKRQLEAFERWSTDPVVFQRPGAPLSPVTWAKRSERLRSLAYYTRYIALEPCSDDDQLSLERCCTLDNLEGYLSYLLNDRGLQESSLVDHISMAVGLLKFVFRTSPDSQELATRLKCLRVTRNAIQRKANANRRTEVDMRADGEWVDQQTLLAAVARRVKEVDAMITDEEMPPRRVAVQLRNVLILLWYTSLPPSRGSYIRTLQLNKTLHFVDGYWYTSSAEFKTRLAMGKDATRLSPDAQGTLIRLLQLYIQRWRKYLLDEEADDHGYLFIPTRGDEPLYSAKSWTKLLQRLTEQLCGVKNCGSTRLRQIFLTDLLNDVQTGANPALRTSAARSMRHSLTAQQGYSRTTQYQDKQLALDFTGARLNAALESAQSPKKSTPKKKKRRKLQLP